MSRDYLHENLTIVINSCDAYSDVWDLFFLALEEFWPNSNIKVLLNTETLQIKNRNMVETSNYSVSSGEDRWGERLLYTLNSIQTDYVMMIYDDFILEDFIDEEKLISLIKNLELNKKIAVHYLSYLSSKIPLTLENKECGQSLVKQGVDYRLNSAPAVWRRTSLIGFTGKNDTPWAWEVFGSYRTFNCDKLFYAPVDKKEGLYQYNFNKGGAIYRGKWVFDVVDEKNRKYGLSTDYSKRGISAPNFNEKRSVKWKINFLLLGYKMVGFKVFMFVPRYLKAKFGMIINGK